MIMGDQVNSNPQRLTVLHFHLKHWPFQFWLEKNYGQDIQSCACLLLMKRILGLISYKECFLEVKIFPP